MKTETFSRLSKAVWKRKRVILVPPIIATAAIVLVFLKFAPVYKATSVLTISPLTLGSVGETSTQERIHERLISTLNEDLNLLVGPSIARFDLFREEKAKGASLDALAERVRTNIVIEADRVSEKGIASFRISYYDYDREQARAVASALGEGIANLHRKGNTDYEIVSIDNSGSAIEPPVAAKRLRLAGLGFTGALFLSILVVTSFELLRDKNLKL
jgi:capsular polysaccharide biosynthesis protein